MRQHIVIVTLLITANISYSQVGIGTSSPAGSSQLDVSSTTKGLLPPRMTTSQRDAISSPATGLQIYNTDNRAIEIFSGSTGEWFSFGRGKGAVGSNTSIGVNTLFSNTTGQHNVAAGYGSLYSNTSGSNNTAYGRASLYFNTTASHNTAFGRSALYENTTAHSNTAVGSYSLTKNTTASYNTAFGRNALYKNTVGHSNTAVGAYSLSENTTGDYHTAVGRWALYKNTTADHNTAMGWASLYNNTTGAKNTAVGYYSLYANASGSNNTAIGYDADIAFATQTNSTSIGYNATASASNKVRIGNGQVTEIGGIVAWTNLSDGRLKENVQENVPGLAFISELRPVTYTLNTKKFDEISMQAMPDSIRENRMLSDEDYFESSSIVRTGFIAQEVEAAAKKVGFDFDGVSTPENESDLYSIRYAEFVVPLVKAMQEQQKTIEELQATVKDLLIRIESLE